jgi:hypothetical protein
MYEVTVNGQKVFVYPCHTSTITDAKDQLRPDRHTINIMAPAAFCNFDMTGPVDVEVKVLPAWPHGPVKSAVVRPLRHGIKPDASLKFRIEKPGKFSFEPNGSVTAPLFIFANPPAEKPPAGATVFGPGVHDIGLYKPKSDSTIYLAGGAYVYGQIEVEGVTNVTVCGRGILDGSRGTTGRHQNWLKCRNITVEGLTLINCKSWGFAISHCDNVTIRNVKIINPNADAVDVCSSENVLVTDVFARTHDDTFNVKGLTDALGHGYPADKAGKWLPIGNRRPARNIRYENCVAWDDRAHVLMIGPETRATEISDIVFRDIDVIHALSVDVVGIFSSDAAPIRNVLYENLRIEDPRVMTLFEVRAHPAYTTADPTCGPVSNVVFRNISITHPTPVHSAICADNAPITGVHFENVQFNGVRAKTIEDMRLHIRGDVKDVTVQ